MGVAMDESKLLEIITGVNISTDKNMKMYIREPQAKLLLTAIKAELPGPLEVYLADVTDYEKIGGKEVFEVTIENGWGLTKQEAIDFCNKYGLRIKGE